MTLSSFERETIINWNSGENTASIYTAEPKVWARIERLPGFRLIRTNQMDGKAVSKEFEFSRAYIRFGKKWPHGRVTQGSLTKAEGTRQGIGSEKRGADYLIMSHSSSKTLS